jgi:hypothetical protein
MMTDPTKSSAATAAGIAADYSARATYARGFEDGSRHVDEVGIQLAALRERLRLAMAVVKRAREVITEDESRSGTYLRRVVDELADAIDALDAVPGDVLDTTGARWVGPDGEPER